MNTKQNGPTFVVDFYLFIFDFVLCHNVFLFMSLQ